MEWKGTTMETFALISRPTVLFRVVQRFVNAAGVDCVYGVTGDGKRQTVARAVDVVWGM